MTDEKSSTSEERRKEAEEDAKSDTIAASIVRAIGGDEAARTFRDIFGDWF